MSNNVNTQLLERASEMQEYWTGTLHAEKIEAAMLLNDMEMLHGAVVEAELACKDSENLVV